MEREKRPRGRENEKVGREEEGGNERAHEEEKKTLEAGYYRLVRRWKAAALHLSSNN